GVEEQYYLIWPLVLVVLAALLAAVARRRHRLVMQNSVHLAVVVLAVAGAIASAAASVVLVSDGTLDRVYFGTDTRAEALLIGAAMSALLVRDWPALTAGRCVIRSRLLRRVTGIAPVLGLAGLAAGAHYATGSPAEFRHGMLVLTAVAALARIAPVALGPDGAGSRLPAF